MALKIGGEGKTLLNIALSEEWYEVDRHEWNVR